MFTSDACNSTTTFVCSPRRREPTNPFRFIGNDSGLGFNSNVSWWSRTTPFHTFVTCSNARGAYCDTVDGVEFGRFANYDIVPDDRQV